VLNNCMRFYTMRTLHRQDGKPYQPNGVVFRLKTLFGDFARRGITIKLSNDFKMVRNSFTKSLSTIWDMVQQEDATFGCRPTKGTLPDNYDELIHKAVVEEAKMTYDGSVLKDIQALFALKLGTMFGFRGNKVSAGFPFLLNSLSLTNRCYN